MSAPLFKNLLGDFVSLFFPRCCVGCHDSLVKGEETLCTGCLRELPLTNYHLETANPLKARMAGRIPVEFALAFLKFTKSGRTQHLLHSLKYKGNAELGVTLGRVFAQRLTDVGGRWPFDAIVPVPLHPTRLRRRGYNQSVKFSQGLSEVLEIPVYENVVIRRSQTETQTKKSKLKRWENVHDVFEVVDKGRLFGKHLLITDDVITTGATIEACASSLIQSARSTVSIASIAVA